MTTRLPPTYGPVQYGLKTNRSTVPAVQTEFCIQASKLNLGGFKTNDRPGEVVPSSSESHSRSHTDSESNITKPVDHSNAMIVQTSAPRLPGFNRLANRRQSKCDTFGVMGRKYLKKPAKNIPDKSTKSESAKDCSSGTEALTLQTIEACSPTPSVKGHTPRSSFVPTAFGFRKIRTDTFSGLSRNKQTKGSNLEKDIAEGARRHIIACHIAPTARRGCRAVQDYYALRDCVSPIRKFSRQMSFKSQNSASTVSIESGSKPQAYQLRSSKAALLLSSTSMSSLEQQHKLPEVIGRVINNQPKSQKLFEIV